MKSKVLLHIAKLVLKKARIFAPISSNREHRNTAKLLWLNAMRASKDDRGIRDWIFTLTLDLGFTGDDSETLIFIPVQIQPQIKLAREDGYISLLNLNDFVFDELSIPDDKVRHKDGSIYGSKHLLERVARNVIKWGIGNCSDLSILSLILLMHYQFDSLTRLAKILNGTPIEIIALTGSLSDEIEVYIDDLDQDDEDNDNPEYDHEFVVINRTPGSKLRDPKTWGNPTEVIILDAWTNECYPLSELLANNRTIESVRLIREGIYFGIRCENSFILGEGPSQRWLKKSAEKGYDQSMFHFKHKR